MWNGLSIFVTIFQGLLALIKWTYSIIVAKGKTYKEIYIDIVYARIKRKFGKLNKNRYNYKYLKGAKLLFILKEFFTREEAIKFIYACQKRGYLIFDKNFDVNKKIIIKKEDELIEKIINTCKP